MPIEAILESSRAGLTHERHRLELASRNIATANVPIPSQSLTSQQSLAIRDFQSVVGNSTEGSEAPVSIKKVYEPNHPLADAGGMVSYPDVDLVHEMATLLTASRGYEANVRAFNMLRGMTLQALEIGAK